jgi:hypothetical protein
MLRLRSAAQTSQETDMFKSMHIAAQTLAKRYNTTVRYSTKYHAFVDVDGEILGCSMASAAFILIQRKNGR